MIKTIRVTAFIWLATASAGFADDGAIAKNESASGTPSGSLQLEFRDQPWPEVLHWLADHAGLNLDWQELPEGTLNLSSNAPLSLADAHDVINMQLLARGYTLLERGEVLRVANLEKLDPTLVDRALPEQLGALPSHQFVRVSFPMDWLIAEEAVDEFKPLLSPYGKLHAMNSTNRLEAVDAVINLRELHRLLVKAENDEGRRDRVEEFHLEHRSVADIAPKVRQLLGLVADPKPAEVPTQLDIEKTKFQSEAVRQLGEAAKPLLAEKPDVHLVVNDEENSILVHARADKLEIARQAIAALDKPLPPRESPWENLNRVKAYPVEGFDPATITRLVDAMRQAGKLDEQTRVDHEATFNRLVVMATPEDHMTIGNLIRNFTCETRQAEVIPLASLEPTYAAKAVQAVLKNPARPAQMPGNASNGTFQIEPDTQNKRLLLWATPDEASEVRKFLLQLGETFVDRTLQTQVHVVQTRGVGLAALQGQLKALWSQVSDAPLVIEAAPVDSAAEEPEDEQAEERPADDASADATTQLLRLTSLVADDVSTSERNDDRSPNAPADDPELAASPAAVRLIEQADGRVVIASGDVTAAAAARSLIQGLLPPVGAVHMISLEFASAVDLRPQLMTMLQQQNPTPSSSLTPAPTHSIDVDARTNTLILQNMSDEQHELVKQMVDALDRPPTQDDDQLRVQRIYRVRSTDAEKLAETLKEVYRDLLSKSDKAFSANNNHQALGYPGGVGGPSAEPNYQGLLAVSADAESNSLIISSPRYLIEEVMLLVAKLDEGPADSSVGIVPLSSRMDPEAVMKALDGVLAKKSKD
jgi:type II secretory pathway component GspD/PulD (secretin)